MIARCELCGGLVDGTVEDGPDFPGGYPKRKVRPDVVVEVLGQKRTLCPSCAVLPAEELMAKLEAIKAKRPSIAGEPKWAGYGLQPSVVADPITIEGTNPE